jgi:hypothetical protein
MSKNQPLAVFWPVLFTSALFAPPIVVTEDGEVGIISPALRYRSGPA